MYNTERIALTCVLVLLCASCRSSSADELRLPASIAATPTSKVNETLGPGDVLSVRVFREPDLSGKYQVPDQGPVDFPLIGSLELLGRTPFEIQEEVSSRLAAGYLVNPQVIVFVEERNSQRIYVLGEVNKPGTFPYQPNMTVIEAITVAGGFSKLASKNGVKISRTTQSEEIVIRASVGSISSGAAPNIRLLPGDIVFVPEALF